MNTGLRSFFGAVFVSLVTYLVFYSFPTTTFWMPRDLSYRLFNERCSDEWITRNLTHLKMSLEDNVFGQHVATKLILSTFVHRWSTNFRRRKPLVASFHGWTGSGKNYVTKFIVESLFERGLESKFVHLFVSTLHFPDIRKSDEYRKNLQDWIKGNVSECGQSVFIFDEIDKMPVGVIDGLRSFMDFHEVVGGVDFRGTIFILLSNTGGREITKKVYEFWTKGADRSELGYSDLEDLVSRGAFNENGGLHHSEIIDRSLIDLYVPFLPLERQHVKKCAERELQRRHLNPKDHLSLIDEVANQINFWPEDVGVFATAGCKRISQKVDELLYSDDEILL